MGDNESPILEESGEDWSKRLKRKAFELIYRISDESPRKLRKTSSAAESNFNSLLSFGAIRDRLRSYAPPNWMGIPSEISPRDFARCGWKCVAPVTLQCVSCKNYVHAGLPSLLTTDPAVFKEAKKNLVDKVINGHETTCAMRLAYKDDAAYPFDVKEYKRELVHRCSLLNALTWKPINFQHFDDVTEDIVVHAKAKNRVIATLACCGWNISEDDGEAMECDYCGRTVGLYLFKECVFDAQNEHFQWCDFVHEGDDGTPAWKKRLRIAFAPEKKVFGPEVEFENKKEFFASLVDD